MTPAAPTYGVVTPARNEASNLAALAACLVAQTMPPESWIIVDDGSMDGTSESAQELARNHAWATVLTLPAAGSQARGGPVVRAFMAGVRGLEPLPDVIV